MLKRDSDSMKHSFHRLIRFIELRAPWPVVRMELGVLWRKFKASLRGVGRS